MSIFNKWMWIKRNWQYILEEATDLGLVFVGGTVLNLVLFNEYRASEDIDLYDPNSENIGTKHEQECLEKLAKKLNDKGFEIKSKNERSFLIGPNIKVEIFNDGTAFKDIKERKIDGINVKTFDLVTHGKMKMNALLCRTIYDPKDLVDLYIIKKQGKVNFTFPTIECDVIENKFSERLNEIKKTKKEDFLIFQTDKQIEDLIYAEFEEFKRWLYEWLSRFR